MKISPSAKAAALALACATPAAAQLAPAVSSYRVPGGVTNIPATGVNILGWDATGAPCVVGNPATPTCAAGGGGGGGGGAITASDGAIVTLGSTGDSAYAGSGSATLAAILKGIYASTTGPIPGQTSHGINIGGVEGVTGSGAAASENPIYDGGLAVTGSWPTAVSNGQKVAKMLTPDGRTVTSPYSGGSFWVRGSVSTTTTSAATLLAANATMKNYLNSLECGRTDPGVSAVTVTLNDTASTVIVVPNAGNGGVTNVKFDPPLVTSATNAALTVTWGSAITSGICSGQGFVAP